MAEKSKGFGAAPPTPGKAPAAEAAEAAEGELDESLTDPEVASDLGVDPSAFLSTITH